MFGRHCRCPAIWVEDVNIVWVFPKELHLVNKRLHLTGTDMALEEYWSGSSQPSGVELPDMDRQAKQKRRS